MRGVSLNVNMLPAGSSVLIRACVPAASGRCSDQHLGLLLVALSQNLVSFLDGNRIILGATPVKVVVEDGLLPRLVDDREVLGDGFQA